jgi:hypothetical protein
MKKIFLLFGVMFGLGWMTGAFCNIPPRGDLAHLQVIDYEWFRASLLEAPSGNIPHYESSEPKCRQMDPARCGRDNTSLTINPGWNLEPFANLAQRFVYRTTILNSGTDQITGIAWDYVFFDPLTGEELGRHGFYTDCRIGPGETKTLSETSLKPPTWTVSIERLESKESIYNEKVELKGVKYRGESDK